MELKVEVQGVEQLRAEFGSLLPRRIQFAVLKALDRTADKTKDRLYSEMHRVFHRPTPYTLGALRLKPPTMSNLQAEVGFKEPWAPRSTKYLEPQVEGGPRRRKGFEVAMSRFGVRGLGMRGIQSLVGNDEYLIPAREVPLNQYGNVSPGLIQKILSGLQAQPDRYAQTTAASRKRKKSNEWYFITRAGIWQRKGRRVTMLFFRTSKPPTYSARFPFYTLAHRFANETYQGEFVTALGEALIKSKQ
jgi:hypothetical protein